MNTLRRRPLFPLCVILVIPLFAAPPAEEKLHNQIVSILEPLAKGDAPGFAVLVKRDGKILFEKGYGVRKLGAAPANDAQTNFRLASFTKQFTAMAIMLLVHDGKLRYDDRLADLFPGFPAYGRRITVLNLLTHTSGLPDYEDLMEREEQTRGATLWSAEHQIQDDEVLALLEHASAGRFDPGTSWAYSNSGYVVLGLIVAKASGMPYRDFLQKRIFTPAGMRHSVVYQKGINEATNRAFGNSLDGGKWTPTDQSSTSATLGDGGIYSNLDDLAKWDEALQKHTLLSEKEMEPALTPVKLADGSAPRWPIAPGGDNLDPGGFVSYGFGWFLDPWQNQARMWHSGNTMGFSTIIQRFPRDGFTIILLANQSDFDTKGISDRIAALLLTNRE